MYDVEEDKSALLRRSMRKGYGELLSIGEKDDPVPTIEVEDEPIEDVGVEDEEKEDLSEYRRQRRQYRRPRS